MTSSRNWTLIDILDVPVGSVRCEHMNCRRPLRYVFVLAQDDDAACVGSECVKAMTHTCDPEVALRAIQGQWRQHRRYIYKKFGRMTWRIGQNAGGRWWVGFAPTLEHQPAFVHPTYTTVEGAKRTVAVFVSTTSPEQMMQDWRSGL